MDPSLIANPEICIPHHCDELKPSCGSCVKLGRRCEQVSPALKFCSVNIWPREKGKQQQPRPRKGTTISSVNIASFIDEDSSQRRQCTLTSRKTVPPTISTPSPCSSGFLSAGSPSGTVDSLSSTDGDDTDLTWRLDTESDHNFLAPPTEWALSDSSFPGTQLDLEPADDTCMRIAPALVLHHDYSLAIKFYMNVWRNHCLPALHLSFHHLEALCRQSRLITDTMATLSACRLSRTLPQRRLLNALSASSLCFRPDAGHESLSGELYGYAMRKMSWWSREELDSQPIVALAVLVLFCYLESSMGHFQEFQVHSKAVEKLLTSYSDRIMSTGRGLLAAWVEVKMQNWWRRAHFGVPDFYRDWSVPLFDPILFKTMSTTTAYRRASVLWILCESHRLSTARIIACYEKKFNDQMMASYGASLLKSLTSTGPEHKPSEKELVALMRVQSERLDEWHASLRDHDLPEVMKTQDLWNAVGMQKPEDAAIRFRSHSLAINYAYYVTARVMQCTKFLQSLGNDSLVDIDDPYEETEIWIQILLRIAAGIDWNECIRLSVYTIGLAGLLLACALRSRKLATGRWVQEWLEERLKEDDGFEEGNFPVFQILIALQIINCERSNGRDVISLFQTVDDGGGSGKFGSYSSQFIQSFLVYARCHETGNLYSYQVSPGDLRPKS
ncbi:uncharacterized protein PAC_17588 [Phialocephala subalpina]|uniref:Zn(2)-C6 fungal-type domain-containing protein n=1 Tax=Phialocephala subalpina TaxID=576137 RepID=A0A1L7XRR0_9HELO|nr:uncharacterized protein PAC_17588 [Phialocephala subalpina]